MKKEKISVSLSEEVIRLEEENRARLGFSSRSELIEAAVKEYIARDTLNHFSQEVARIHNELEHHEVKEMEERLAMLSYKIAVEMAQINLTLAYLSEFTDRDVHKLRERAVRLVNQSKGFVNLPMARKNQVDLNEDQ
jgi:metal-responsive CopG/Arc/MetJ family transcriptional regulator